MASTVNISPYSYSLLIARDYMGHKETRLTALWMQPFLEMYQKITGLEKPLLWHTVLTPLHYYNKNPVFILKAMRYVRAYCRP